MAARKPNMLEAFQQSARAAQEAHAREERAPKQPAQASAAPSSPKPVQAPREPAGGISYGSELLGTNPLPRRGIPTWIPVAVVVLLVAMVGAYWVARELGREAAAGEPGTTSLPAEAEQDLSAISGAGSTPVKPPSEADPVEQLLSANDLRFLDTANRITVMAIQYPNTAQGRGLAEKARAYLDGAGLPVISPVERGKDIVVLVGAAPDTSGLEQIRTKLRATPGPPPQNEPGAFEDAYYVNIDDWIDR
jgi:hypothetical protein